MTQLRGYPDPNNKRDSMLVGATGKELIFENTPDIVNIYQQGQYSTNIPALSNLFINEITYPSVDKRPPIKELTDMVERDPVVAKCVALKALRAVQSFGSFTHSKKEIESFINSNINTLKRSFKKTLFKLISCVILYGYGIAEFTFSSKLRGHRGEWRLANINVLNPERITKFIGKRGNVHAIEYDNGDGKLIKIPYEKCIHIINNSGTGFDEMALWGVGDGIAALNYYKLKKVVLTQLALATKNNATGIVHAKVPNVGRTILVDSKMQALKDYAGKPIEVTKQIALNYQLQDLYKKDYIVTDVDVDIQRIEIQNNERFWEYALNYIDRAIQMAFSVPVGIFDSGTSGLQNVGLSQNFKSVFDSTIFALTNLLKEEIINKIVRKLCYYNFPSQWFETSLGEFIFDVEEDQDIINGRLSTISSLIASGILDKNDVEVISLIRKNLGLPALTETEKTETSDNQLKAKITAEIQAQLEQMQLQQQIQMMQQPPMPPQDPNAAAQGGAAPAEGDYPPGGA